MHPSRSAEELLFRLRDDQPQNIRDDLIKQASIFAALAVAEAIRELGSDIREAAKDIALELGSLAIATGEK